MVRFRKLIGKTIVDATEKFVERDKLNSFMDRGLIKVIHKGGTDSKELKNWGHITLLSQIYKLISGVIAERMNYLLAKIISGCQKAYKTQQIWEDEHKLLNSLIGKRPE